MSVLCRIGVHSRIPAPTEPTPWQLGHLLVWCRRCPAQWLVNRRNRQLRWRIADRTTR